ncbi:MAG: hypothetical protein OEQ39_21955 [Gammaproteobacteria bacterium]|nr:hypothetical protein [Gammaproteobacteria bacterium]MDH3468598.1 hypothetical protein [Gammaproteobacteria bacterium]
MAEAKNSHYSSLGPYGVAFGLLGIAVGLFAGLSQSPVIGVLLPLLFGLIGGAGGLYVAKVNLDDTRDRQRLRFLGILLSIFLVLTVLAGLYGMLVRTGSGLFSLVPHLTDNSASLRDREVEVPEVEGLTPDEALELALLRYRLHSIGASDKEQAAVLSTARQELVAPQRRQSLSERYASLSKGAEQIAALIEAAEREDRGQSPSSIKQIARLAMIRQSQYNWLAARLLEVDPPPEELVKMLERHSYEYGEILRYRSDGDKFFSWLENHPLVGQRIWDFELRYFETLQFLRGRSWRSGSPAAEAVDALIGTRSTTTGASSSVARDAERQTGMAR